MFGKFLWMCKAEAENLRLVDGQPDRRVVDAIDRYNNQLMGIIYF